MARLVPKTAELKGSAILQDILLQDPHSGYSEYQSGNFEQGNRSDARYRAFQPTLLIPDTFSIGPITPTIEVPSRLEVLTHYGWKQHPIVFQTPKSQKEYQLNIVLTGRKYTTTWIPAMTDRCRDFLREAEQLGLTQGRTTGIRSIVREIID